MLRTPRWVATAAAAAAMAVAVASPAQAAPTVRALWNMSSVPTMVDEGADSVANTGRTTGVTMVDGYYSFDGTSSIAKVPHKTNLNPGAADITLEARVDMATPPAAGETYDILRKGVTTTVGGYYKIELKGRTDGGVNVACIFKDKSRTVGQVIGLASTDWLTITCTKTAASVTLVANGATRTTSTAVGAISNKAPVYIGGKGDGTDEFHGLMDYVSITIG